MPNIRLATEKTVTFYDILRLLNFYLHPLLSMTTSNSLCYSPSDFFSFGKYLHESRYKQIRAVTLPTMEYSLRLYCYCKTEMKFYILNKWNRPNLLLAKGIPLQKIWKTSSDLDCKVSDRPCYIHSLWSLGTTDLGLKQSS